MPIFVVLYLLVLGQKWPNEYVQTYKAILMLLIIDVSFDSHICEYSLYEIWKQKKWDI